MQSASIAVRIVSGRRPTCWSRSSWPGWSARSSARVAARRIAPRRRRHLAALCVRGIRACLRHPAGGRACASGCRRWPWSSSSSPSAVAAASAWAAVGTALADGRTPSASSSRSSCSSRSGSSGSVLAAVVCAWRAAVWTMADVVGTGTFGGSTDRRPGDWRRDTSSANVADPTRPVHRGEVSGWRRRRSSAASAAQSVPVRAGWPAPPAARSWPPSPRRSARTSIAGQAREPRRLRWRPPPSPRRSRAERRRPRRIRRRARSHVARAWPPQAPACPAIAAPRLPRRVAARRVARRDRPPTARPVAVEPSPPACAAGVRAGRSRRLTPEREPSRRRRRAPPADDAVARDARAGHRGAAVRRSAARPDRARGPPPGAYLPPSPMPPLADRRRRWRRVGWPRWPGDRGSGGGPTGATSGCRRPARPELPADGRARRLVRRRRLGDGGARVPAAVVGRWSSARAAAAATSTTGAWPARPTCSSSLGAARRAGPRRRSRRPVPAWLRTGVLGLGRGWAAGRADLAVPVRSRSGPDVGRADRLARGGRPAHRRLVVASWATRHAEVRTGRLRAGRRRGGPRRSPCYTAPSESPAAPRSLGPG